MSMAMRIAAASLGICAFAALPASAGASQTPKAAWKITSTSLPTNMVPGSEGSIFLVAENLGTKATEGPITIADEVPANFKIAKNAKGEYRVGASRNDLGLPQPTCDAVGQTAICMTGATGSGDIAAGSTKVTGFITTAGTFAVGNEIRGTGIPAATTIVSQSPTELTLSNAATLTAAGVELTVPSPLRPGYHIEMEIVVIAPPDPEVKTNKATVKGGGAVDDSATSTLVASSEEAIFDFPPGDTGLDAHFTDPDGAPTTQAGSHPYQLTIGLGLPTERSGAFLVSAEHVHDIAVDFPPGVLINPAATPELCTEAELIRIACPPGSQLGIATALTIPAAPLAGAAALYNMVPPAGEAAVLGTDALGVGVFVHLLGELRSDSDYGLTGYATEIPALPSKPVFGSRVDLWGDPSDASHDDARGACAPPSQEVPTGEAWKKLFEKDCEVPSKDVALLTLPGHCSGEPLGFGARAHSWEQMDFPPAETSYESADLAGNPTQITGCDQLKFEPTLKLRPTTNLTDSPSGLDAELIQVQNFKLLEKAPSPLRDAVVTLPAGLVANASQADGLAACSGAQIGMLSAVGESPVRLSKAPESCPDGAKLGTVEVESPLLAQIDEEDNIVLDADGQPVPRLVKGSLYLAKPFDNPFNSLIAIYIVVDDARSGIVAKLAGRVEPDPATGQLTTRFEENPQLPLENVRLKLFSGSRAPLQTPPTCATYTSASTLTPWAAPDLPDVGLTDSFALSAFPGAGACPATATAAPHAPAFSAGTLTPKAGAFSPTVLKLSREDGSQRLSKVEATLPAGLSAKLAGLAQCSEAQIAAASARSAPEEGKLEQASPSCPAASALGSTDVGAGAGPSPVHIGGRIYLAGPYKGAPLSVVAITPAIAGPFDLGTVVVRSALQIDPTTAQGRVVSDPFPQILQGIPANVRSVAVNVDRPRFSLNPTSCDPKSFAGTATSALGHLAPLTERFQVGGCEPLRFKPTLSMRLFGPTNRGAHPRFRAILTAKGGEANIARSVVTLPKSEFIDQAHFQTICTRVQYAANQCPPGSIYGYVKARSPLLDYPVQGPIYLRSSSQELPDVVLALRGPAHQPIAIDVVGHNDSVKGRLRITFDTIPDAPISQAIITMRGASKGLFQNSTNICAKVNRATVKMNAHNGKIQDTRPPLKASCKGKGAKGKGRKAKAGRR
jgi:hypothetical protein